MLKENLFFRRKKAERGELKDYYSEDLTNEVRYKIAMALFSNSYGKDETSKIVFNMEMELGKPISKEYDPFNKLKEYMSKCNDEKFLSIIEVTLSVKYEMYLEENNAGYIESYYEETPPQIIKRVLIELIKTINEIFRIDKIGYEIKPSDLKDLPFMIVPFNSMYLHQEVIKKPMSLMYDENFEGPLNEFESALDEYRNQNYKKAIHLANNAYESTLKTILYLKNVEYTKFDKIPVLVDKIRNESNIIDSKLMSAFDSVWGVLKNGPHTIRNMEGIGHGQGKEIKKIEKSYADLVLRLVGTYIVFLIERLRENI